MIGKKENEQDGKQEKKVVVKEVFVDFTKDNITKSMSHSPQHNPITERPEVAPRYECIKCHKSFPIPKLRKKNGEFVCISCINEKK